MKELTKKTWRDYMPKRVWIYDIDRDDSFDHNHELLQECVEKNSLEPLHNDEIWDCLDMDYPIHYYLDDIKKDMSENGLHKDYEDHLGEICDYLWEKDESDPIGDMLNNTYDQQFFYSLDLDVEASVDYMFSEEYYTRTMKKICDFLGIEKGSESEENIRELLENYSMGGELRIYFEAPLKDMICESGKDFSTIKFDGYFGFAIKNCITGDGNVTEIELNNKVFKFDRKALAISDAVEYNPIEKWCGLCPDWLTNYNKPEFAFAS